MAYNSLQNFVRVLEQAGEIKRVSQPMKVASIGALILTGYNRTFFFFTTWESKGR
jgi:3-polyprenyl-4-hydroxybenzoate decarboxylase